MDGGLSDRKREILHNSCAIIASKGYAAFTMRAVARACDLKLGALQYHYRTRDELLRAVTRYIALQTEENFERYLRRIEDTPENLHAWVNFILVDPLAEVLEGDRLFPQLWAMSLVEPLVKDLMDALYAEYLGFLEEVLRARGVKNPRAEALVVMALLEGVTLFVGQGCAWEDHVTDVVEAVHKMLAARYGVMGDVGAE